VERAPGPAAGAQPCLDAGAQRSDTPRLARELSRQHHPSHRCGSDTTRHSITGGLWALNQNPKEYAKLRANPALIESMVPEIIRFQSPVAHMRRTALSDTEIGGKAIKKGEKVIMWYVSGNRDEDAIDRPDEFVIDRERPRQHVSFGFGIHRCVGMRLAEMQLRIMWEEILKRFPVIEVVEEPKRMNSNFVKGYDAMMVRIPA
jgi:cytochrome P450